MTWIQTRLRLPPQGKKVLWFNDGDCWVAQRFGKYWFPIPFCDSTLARIDAPVMWQDISLPDRFHGYMQLYIENKFYTIDEVEKEHNDVYRHFVNQILVYYRRKKKSVEHTKVPTSEHSVKA